LGGAHRTVFEDDTLAFEDCEILAFDFEDPVLLPVLGTDTIGFALTEAPDGGTIFVLTEELSANHAARNAAGWDACLDRLQLGAETESWKPRFDRYAATFEPVLGHQDGPPEGVLVSDS